MKNLLFLLVFLSFQTLNAQNVTLEQLMSAPFYSTISVSPKGNRVVWLKNERGVRNIEIADAPDFKPRLLTHFDADDGVEIANFQWTKDENALFFVRGNAPQVRAREPHNPAHLLEGTTPTIFKINIADGKTVKIANGSTPSVSPDGMRLIFMKSGQIFSKNADDTLAAKQLTQIRNGCGSVRLSPDGSKLAFVSSRGGHSFVGIFDFKQTDYKFLNPSTDRDIEPAWSPDGSELAFIKIRNDGEKHVMFTPERQTEPWSIVVANVSTGKTRTVFTAEKGVGSVFHEHNGAQQLLWTADNRLVFPYEKTGWLQLYTVSATGGETALLSSRGAANANFDWNSKKSSVGQPTKRLRPLQN